MNFVNNPHRAFSASTLSPFTGVGNLLFTCLPDTVGNSFA